MHTTSPLLPEPRWLDERDRLIRLCAMFTGNIDVAEDLAQETLLEAWRHLHALRDAERLSSWLAGIAHNVCLRWIHDPRRQAAQRAVIPLDETLAAVVPGTDDVARDVERMELIAALNQALAQLPHDLSDLFLAHYVAEDALRDVARHHHLTTTALAKRLQRGKLAFRAILAEHPEHWQHLLTRPLTPGWETTSIWCPLCGAQPWQARHVADTIEYACAHCHASALPEITTRTIWSAKGYKRILLQMMVWVEETYRPFLGESARACPQCGRLVPLTRHGLTLQLHCPQCHTINDNTLPMLALGSAEGRAFWRHHPKIQLQPIREDRVDGQTTKTITYREVGGRAAFAATFVADTFAFLAAHRLS